MRSVVFSLKGNEKINKTLLTPKISFTEVRYHIKKYGFALLAFILLLCGLIFGAIYAEYASQGFLDSLDFLFITNLEARLSQNTFGTFCACFASDFIFLTAVFLLGISPWGIPLLPLILIFKGFGIGLTAGYLFILYSFKGIGFYLLIILPGTFLFSISLVLITVNAFYCSKRIFLAIISKTFPQQLLHKSVVNFSSRSMSLLIMTFCAAILDSALWTLFAGTFNF